jgi:poly-D-alanine transfer protein DltD
MGWGACVYARHLADRRLWLLGSRDVPFKFQALTFQRAALASGRVLPIYGSSELFCCGDPFRPTQLFSSDAADFEILAIGHAGAADLFFMETFAALGRHLRGRKVVLSDSPSWFTQRGGVAPRAYGHSFLPEVAYPFAFDAPLSRELREAGARRMLAYPDTLSDEPLLRLALEDLAYPTAARRVEYAALAPLGRLASRLLEVRDALRATAFVWRHRRHQRRPPSTGPLEWPSLAAAGTRIAERRDTTNPFGFPDPVYRRLRGSRRFQSALALHRSGATNREGTLLPPPSAWEAAIAGSPEWTDLRLALRVLHELGAEPLVWSLPLPGAYQDYTPFSAAERRGYYDRYERTVEPEQVAWLDFRAHDEDPYFLNDPGSHLSARGWVFADRALDMFWHGRSMNEVRAELATLADEVPPPAPPRAGDG